MPYHYAVSRIVGRIWARMNAGDLDAPSRMATAQTRFTVVGDTVIGGRWHGRAALRDWPRSFSARFTRLRFEVEDVAVSGWPWRTRVAVLLVGDGTLKDGRPYRNDATQWLTLRWGRMTEDWVLENTKIVDAAFEG